MRKSNYFKDEFTDNLRQHGLGFVLLDRYYMPPIPEVAAEVNIRTAPFSIIRLHGAGPGGIGYPLVLMRWCEYLSERMRRWTYRGRTHSEGTPTGCSRNPRGSLRPGVTRQPRDDGRQFSLLRKEECLLHGGTRPALPSGSRSAPGHTSTLSWRSELWGFGSPLLR